MDLSDILNKYGSDKDVNGYSSVYHILFGHKRFNEMKMVEVGIGTMIKGVPSSMLGYGLGDYRPGASLRAWRDYFENSQIYGVDVQPDTQFEEERIKTFLCDSRDPSIRELMEPLGPFDIIIDDGLHSGDSQLRTLANLFPLVKEGGIYVVEDVCQHSVITPEKVTEIVGQYPFFFALMNSSLCIIEKIPLNRRNKKY